MSGEWAMTIKQRLDEYNQRREELRAAYVEVVDELKRVIPNQQIKWEINAEVPIATFIEVGKKQMYLSEEEIWEVQKIYGSDHEGNVIETGKTTAKEALIKLILDRFKLISGQ